MKKIILFSVMMVLSVSTYAQLATVQEMPVSIPPSFVERVNAIWRQQGESYQLASYDIHYHLVDGKITSVYGHFVMSCNDTVIPVDMVFNPTAEPPEDMKKDFVDRGVHKPKTMDEVIARLSSSPRLQRAVVEFVFGLLLESCYENHSQDKTMSLFLWLSYDRPLSVLNSAYIDKTQFENLK